MLVERFVSLSLLENPVKISKWKEDKKSGVYKGYLLFENSLAISRVKLNCNALSQAKSVRVTGSFLLSSCKFVPKSLLLFIRLVSSRSTSSTASMSI